MGVFEKAKDPGVREAFIASRARKMIYEPEAYEELQSYILSDECTKDIDRLIEGDYFFDYPQYRLVPKNSGTRNRAVYSFKGKPGMLLKLFAFAMHDIEKCYSDRLFSFRTDRSAADLLLEVRANPEVMDYYVLKTDVTNYVGSIVPELLLPMIEELFMPDDPAFYNFLGWLLMRKKVINRDGEVIDHCPGGMGGVPVSNFFMNLYLHEMDDYFAPRAAFYSRYSDDVLICARTYDEVKEFEKKFFEILDRLHLKTNTEKTTLILPGEPFDLLGMELQGGSIRISPHSMAKIKRKLRLAADKSVKRSNLGYTSREEAARKLVDRYNRIFFGIKRGMHVLSWAKWAFPVITDTSSLQEIDHYFQDTLRYVLYGSMKKRNRTIPYEKLGELGYRSLVYYYHHQDKIRELQ